MPVSGYWPGVLGHLYTDRPIYRPGETVFYKGVVRHDQDATYSIPEQYEKFTLRIRDPHYDHVSSTTTLVNELGTFDVEFVLPDDAPTGTWAIRLYDGDNYVTATSFTVAEFRAPDFEVDVETSLANYIDREPIDVATHARFFFGGPVQDARVEWSVVSSPTWMRVEGYEGYSFNDSDRYGWATYERPLRAEGSARTDPLGVARFDVPAALGANEGTQWFTIRATAIDANGQAVASSAAVTVHPAAWYAGVRPESYIGASGEETRVHLVTVDTEGTIAPQRPVTVRIFERTWITTKERSNGGGRSYRSEPLDTEIEVHTATTNEAGEGSITFTPPRSGSYRIVAESTDEQGRVARSSRFLWVSGTQRVQWQVRNDDVIELIADRESYEVGDVARVLVTAPFEGAVGLVTIERGRVLSSEVRVFETNSEVLEILIGDAHLPNIYVGVVLYRAPTEDDPLPRYHVGYVELPVSTAPRRLDVQITPDRERAVPGETVRYEVQVTDWRGRGAAAEVSVAIVDKAVLALADDVGPDGLRAFWFQRALGVYTASSLAVSVDRRNDIYSEAEEGGKGGDGGEYGRRRHLCAPRLPEHRPLDRTAPDQRGRQGQLRAAPAGQRHHLARAGPRRQRLDAGGRGRERAAGHAAAARAPRAAALPARRRRGRAAHARAQRDRGPSRRDGHDRGRGRHPRGRDSRAPPASSPTCRRSSSGPLACSRTARRRSSSAPTPPAATTTPSRSACPCTWT